VTEEVTFILNGDDGFKFYFEGELLIDRWDSCCAQMLASYQLTQGKFYDVVL